MAGGPSKTTVILSTSENWREWLEATKTATEGLGVWEFMDPDITTKQILTLDVPTNLLPANIIINPAKTRVVQLDEAEEKRLRMRTKDYRKGLRGYVQGSRRRLLEPTSTTHSTKARSMTFLYS
jgi:hypothetical protein